MPLCSNMDVKKEKIAHRKVLGILIFLILASDLIIFREFITGKYVYVFKGWGYDTYHQYIPQFELLFQSFKNRDWGLMSFQDGLGNDITALQRWLTDPFTLIILIISLFIGKMEVIPELMVLLPIMVSLCSGICIYCYLKRYANGATGLLIASYMYALCGYLVTAGTHYLFTSFLVYFPLLLISMDRILYEKKYNSFIFVVFLTAVRGIYGAFAMFISAGIYFLYRLPCFSKGKGTFKILFHTIAGAVIGILMSAISLIPNVYEMLVVSSRISSEPVASKILSSIKIISFSELKTALLRMFSNNLEGGVDSWHGTQVWFCAYPYFFSVLFVYLLVQWIYCINLKTGDTKGKTYKQGATVLILLSVIVNFIPSLFNLFSYNQWRMIYVLLPFFAIMSMMVIENILKGVFSHKANILALILNLLGMYWFSDAGFIYNKKVYNMCLFFTLGFALLLTILNVKKVKSKKIITAGWGLMLVLLMANYIMDHRFSVITGASPIEYSETSNYYEDSFLQQSVELINDKENDNFIRVDRTYLGPGSDTCWSYVIPARGVTIYNSLINSNICDYITNIVNYGVARGNGIEYIFAINDYGTYFDSARTALLGLKYIATTQPRNLENWELLMNQGDFHLYENKDIHSAGILYTNYTTENEYESFENYQKAFAESQYVILDESANIIDTNGALQKITPDQISFYDTNTINSDKLVFDNSICIENEHALIAHADEEGSLVIPVTPGVLNSTERNVLSLTASSDAGGAISVAVIAGETSFEEKRENFYIGTEAIDIVSIIPGDCSKIVIYFEGEIKIEGLKILASQNSFSYDVRLENAHMGNTVIGRIHADSESILLTAIPYRQGWKAFVDGKETACIRADYGFTAIQVPSGEHTITFSYKNPVINYGIFISVFGGLVWGLYAFLHRHTFGITGGNT